MKLDHSIYLATMKGKKKRIVLDQKNLLQRSGSTIKDIDTNWCIFQVKIIYWKNSFSITLCSLCRKKKTGQDHAIFSRLVVNYTRKKKNEYNLSFHCCQPKLLRIPDSSQKKNPWNRKRRSLYMACKILIGNRNQNYNNK